jgi:hypothetical protein
MHLRLEASVGQVSAKVEALALGLHPSTTHKSSRRRRNQDIKVLQLRLSRGSQYEWVRHFFESVFDTRRRRNAATGQTPAELLLRRNLTRPGERPATNPANLQHRIEAARANQEIYKMQENAV